MQFPRRILNKYSKYTKIVQKINRNYFISLIFTIILSKRSSLKFIFMFFFEKYFVDLVVVFSLVYNVMFY